MAAFSETTAALEFGALFETGKTDPREVTEFFLGRAKAADPQHHIYLHLSEARARDEAMQAADRARRGLRRHRLDGVPLSWKDNIDSAGIATSAGSLALKDRIPPHDAEVLKRAAKAGAVCLGKTGMTEFAFSGLGINPKRGTPENPFDERMARAPGGSSAGAAVSLSRGLAAGAIGTDTGGSVRIPSGWNGLVGLKTTAGLLPLDGVLPLAPSFDTVGPLAHNVSDAAALLSLLTGDDFNAPDDFDLSGAVFALPGGTGWSELDPGIGASLHAAIRRLLHAGAKIMEIKIPEIDEIDALAWGGGASRLVAEAHAAWGDLFPAHRADIYKPVYERLMAGGDIAPDALATADRNRADIQRRYLAATGQVDAVLLPCVAISPPVIAELEDGGPAYFRANRMALRNCTIGNQLGLCAITLPAGFDSLGMPVGLMMQSSPFSETRLLGLALAVEKCLQSA